MKFEINQEVVCIKDSLSANIKKGTIFTVRGIQSTPCKCKGKILLDVGIREKGRLHCPDCDYVAEIIDDIWWINSIYFRPLEEDKAENEAIEELLKEADIAISI